MANRKTNSSNDNTAITTQAAGAATDDENPNLDDYAAGAELPLYVAPVTPSLSFPLVQYAKGVVVVSGKRPSKYTGWLIAVEQSAELDDLLEIMAVPSVRVKHHNGNEGNYWQLDSIKGYILATAVPDSYGPNSWKKTGIAYVWNEYKGTYNFGSQLQCIFFSKGLLELGYTSPLVLTFSRTVTELFVNKVLRRQEAMIQVIKKALKRQGKLAELAFYAYWFELEKGTEEYMTKDGGSYYPPATTIPGPLTVGYVKEHEAAADDLAVIEAFLPMLPQWAEAASAKLLEPPRDNIAAAGEQPEPGEEPEPEEE